MLFSIGAHPAFNWPLKEDEKKEDYYLEFEDIKQTKRHFLNDKGLVYKSEDLKIVENKIALNEELFKNDALVFNDLNIKQLTFRSRENDNFIKVNFENFPYLGIWSKPSGAAFLCIEPWFGVADVENSTQNLKDKKAMITLQKDEIFSCFYSIKI
jgi:galactose mutarotase-like enzyme